MKLSTLLIRLFLFITIFQSLSTYAQTLEKGATIEYNLPPEDCGTATFYLGRFLIGEYEISANISGHHANNAGWKIIIGSGWGGWNTCLRKVFENINGRFIYQKHDNAYFDLWWDAKFSSGGKDWTPHIKVQYQAGNCIYANKEPERTTAKELIDQGSIGSITALTNGKVGIGTAKPSCTLDVNGTMRANEIVVTTNGNTADFVFDDSYELLPLEEVNAFIKDNHHLPQVPSARIMEENGTNLAEMNKILLQKVEELTLYLIQQNQTIQKQQLEIINIKSQLNEK